MNPKEARDIAAIIEWRHKGHLKNQRSNQRRAWLYFARAVLIFGWLWAVAMMFVLGWLAVRW